MVKPNIFSDQTDDAFFNQTGFDRGQKSDQPVKPTLKKWANVKTIENGYKPTFMVEY